VCGRRQYWGYKTVHTYRHLIDNNNNNNKNQIEGYVITMMKRTCCEKESHIFKNVISAILFCLKPVQHGEVDVFDYSTID